MVFKETTSGPETLRHGGMYSSDCGTAVVEVNEEESDYR